MRTIIIYEKQNTLPLIEGTKINLPLIAKQNRIVGAISLILYFPLSVNIISVKNILSESNLVWGFKDGKLTIAWFASGDGINFIADEEFVSVEFEITQNVDNIAVYTDWQSEIADNSAIVYKDSIISTIILKNGDNISSTIISPATYQTPIEKPVYKTVKQLQEEQGYHMQNIITERIKNTSGKIVPKCCSWCINYKKTPPSQTYKCDIGKFQVNKMGICPLFQIV